VVLTILKNISQWEGLHPIYEMDNKHYLKPPTSYDIQYPLVNSHIAIEHGPFIVDLPIENGGSFHSYVSVYQRVIH